jgi:hypothetical protein
MLHRGTQASVLLGLALQAGAAQASYCSETPLATLTSAPYTSHWDAYDGVVCVEEHFRTAGDRRAIFASVYALTTLRLAESIDDGAYDQTAWMEDYQTEFADHYRRALHDYATADFSAVPEPWLIAFDAAQSGETLILQDIVLGMNAHINFDLAFALEEVGLSPSTSRKLSDHTRVNLVLSEISDEILQAMGGLYGSNYAALDAALGPADELLLGVGMASARQNAWTNAVSLKNSSWWNRWAVELWIEGGANAAADLTLAATISPTLLATLRQLEGSNPGSTFCQHFPCNP